MKRVVFYITGHGFGHASRSCKVIGAFYNLCRELGVAEGLKIDICSSTAPWYFEETLQGCPFSLRPVSLDVGVVQSDSLTLDIKATLDAYAKLVAQKEEIIEREAGFISGADLVFGDIPPFCFAAARRAGVDALAMGNFTWNWIYEPYVEEFPEFSFVPDDIRADYECAKLLLELPFAEGVEVFKRRLKIPLVCLGSKLEPALTRERLGLDRERPCALLSFGGIGLGSDFFGNLEKISGWSFICSEGATKHFSCPAITNITREKLKTAEVCYQDMVRAADVVVTKPGYGIVSECIANNVPIIYTSRGQFREYDGLVRVIKEYLPGSRFVTNEALSRADFGKELGACLDAKIFGALKAPADISGAAAAARIICENLGF